jgi:hypothetical protein
MASKFNFKDFDFKQFMLHHGEWVGLGIAVLIALPTAYLGVRNFLSAGSPTANAASIDNLRTGVEQKLRTSAPEPGWPPRPTEQEMAVNFKPVDPVPYSMETPYFVPTSIEDTKRHEPIVLAPTDFETHIQGGPIPGFILLPGKNGLRVAVLEVKDPYISKRVRDRLKKLGINLPSRPSAGGGMPGAAMPGMPSAGKFGGGMGGMGGGGMMGGGMMGGGGGMQAMMQQQMQGQQRMMQGGGGGGKFGGPPGGAPLPGMSPGAMGGGEMKLSFQDVDNLNEQSHLAEDLYPARMAIITASFPIKQQMEEFRKALRLANLNDLLGILGTEQAAWEFKGFDIERRTVGRSGKADGDWEDVTDEILNQMKFYMIRASDIETADEELASQYPMVVNRGLMMARPKLAHEEKYDDDIPKGVKESMAHLKNIGTEKVQKVLSPLATRLKGQGIDPVNPLAPIGSADTDDKKPETPSPTEDKKSEETDPNEPALPENALVRIIDATVQPGMTYEYRVRLKMANPNYGQRNVAYKTLAQEKEIKATDWTVVPTPVHVPYDVYWYAIDERPTAERLMVQVQRWVDYVHLSDQSPPTPVGDWSMVEKLNAYRGEYVGHDAEVKVPVWRPEKEAFELARNPKTRSRHITVDFTVRKDQKASPALLVDYDGGRMQFRPGPGNALVEDTPVEVLYLTPDGKLSVRTSVADVKDPKRDERLKAWKQWVDEVEKGRAKGGHNAQQNMPGQPGNVLFNKGKGGQ